jgi:hypothetical protein
MSQAVPWSTAQVKAIFEESTLQFEVPPDIPLEKLCTLLATYGQGHGEPLLVEVSWPSPAGDNSVV